MKKLIAFVVALSFLLVPVSSAVAFSAPKLLSPNGGEKYNAGQTINVKWTDSFPEESSLSASIYKIKGDTWDRNSSYGDSIESSYYIEIKDKPKSGSVNVTLPAEALPGNYVFTLDIYYSSPNSNFSASLSSEKAFYITAPSNSTKSPRISAITPSPAYIGDDVTITGTNLQKNSRVILQPVSGDSYSRFDANVIKRGKNSITFKIDQYFLAGNYNLQVANAAGLSEVSSLIVTQNPINPFPFITNISPSSGLKGTTLTITGGNFTDKNDINYYSDDYSYYPTDGLPKDDEYDDKDPNTMPTNGFLTGVKSSDGKTIQFKLPLETLPGAYSISITNTKGYSDQSYFTLLDPNPDAAHATGTNIRDANGTVYYIANGQRTAYPSASVFLSYKFNSWANVVPASLGDMNLPVAKYMPPGSSQETIYTFSPRNGTLVKDRGVVYMVSGDQRIAFSSANVFTSAGYSFANVIDAEISHLVSLAPITTSDAAHPNGTVINDNGTLYAISNGYRVGFPSIAILESWGFSTAEVVPANANDLKAPISHVLGKRPLYQMNLY